MKVTSKVRKAGILRAMGNIFGGAFILTGRGTAATGRGMVVAGVFLDANGKRIEDAGRKYRDGHLERAKELGAEAVALDAAKEQERYIGLLDNLSRQAETAQKEHEAVVAKLAEAAPKTEPTAEEMDEARRQLEPQPGEGTPAEHPVAPQEQHKEPENQAPQGINPPMVPAT